MVLKSLLLTEAIDQEGMPSVGQEVLEQTPRSSFHVPSQGT